MKGRVGDSPIIGSGLFIDNTIGGAVATGMGEEVVKTVGSFLIVELMRQGHSPQEACDEAIHRIVEKQGDTIDFQVAYIALDRQGVLDIVVYTKALRICTMKMERIKILK
jgi:N4-(beta-N-acetylglucosaminyl)-L-asparaginase